MDNLNKLSLTFMKRSMSFLVTCILSICFSVLFINSVYNFSENAITSYQRSIIEEYGDYDIFFTNPNYQALDSDALDQISRVEGIHTLSQGRFDSSVPIGQMDTYLVSVRDDDVMKSRYDYNSDLAGQQIIMNNILANTLGKEVGDYITVNNQELKVIEIIDDKSFYAGGLALAIISSDTYETVLGREYQSNFAMVKLNSRVEPNFVMAQINEIDSVLNVNAIEMDENYQKSLLSMKAYIFVLAVFVLIISSLFIVGIMKQFLYKYLHDVAIMRAIGGDTIRIKNIFVRIIGYVVGSACFLGYLLSVLLNKIVLGYFNTELKLIKGRILFYFGRSFLISFAVFLLIFFILRLSIRRSLKVLPIQALIENETNKLGKRRKEHKHTSLHFYNRLWRDWFLAGKFIGSKLKENILIIITISMISAFAFVGGSLHTLILNNNSSYVKSQYLTDIVVASAKYVSIEEAGELVDTLRKDQEVSASYVSDAITDAQIIIDDKTIDSIEYRLATLETMFDQNIILNEVTSKNSIVVSNELAKKLDLKIGETIVVATPVLYERDAKGFTIGVEKERKYYEFEVGNILHREQMKFADLWIDSLNVDFIQPLYGLESMFVSGKEEKALELLNQLKLEHSGLKWTNYQDVIAYGNQVMKERFFLLEIVIEFLIVIAGIGWYNSMRSIILSHKKKYMYLRIQGISRLRITKIIAIQMFYYIVSGIIIGGILGVGVLYALGIYEDVGLFRNVNIDLLQKVIFFLALLSIFQYPTIKKVGSRVDLKLYS